MSTYEIHYDVAESWAALYVNGKLEQVGDAYLAEERAFERKVAEEIAVAIEAEAKARKAAAYADSGQDYPTGLLTVAAAIARKHREVPNG